MTSTPSDPTSGGDYPDRDLPEGGVDAGTGTYTDQENPREKRGEEPDTHGPRDQGEYTDSDHVTEHRPAPAGGAYTSKDDTAGTNAGTDESEEHRHG